MADSLLVLFLRPVMLAWYAWVVLDLTSRPQPADAPHAHGRGINTQRVLLVGSGPAEGFGTLSHQIALPGHLANELARATGRGVDIDLVVTRRRTIGSASQAVEAAPVQAYDAVIVSIGDSAALTLKSERRWRQEIESLLRNITNATSGQQVFIAGIDPSATMSGFLVNIADGHARRLNRITRVLCAEVGGVEYVQLPKADLPHGRITGAIYLAWAKLLSSKLAPRLREMKSIGARPRSEPAERRRMLKTISSDTATQGRLNDIVELARTYFNTQFASFTLMDDDRAVQTVPTNGPRTGSDHHNMCAVTHALGTSVIIEDTLAYPQWGGKRPADDSGIRSYAGHPVESSNGQRIGVLSISDAEPRQFSRSDVVMLWDLAIMLQRVVSGTDARSSGPASVRLPQRSFTGAPWS